jgi:hypothetical protein
MKYLTYLLVGVLIKEINLAQLDFRIGNILVSILTGGRFRGQQSMV